MSSLNDDQKFVYNLSIIINLLNPITITDIIKFWVLYTIAKKLFLVFLSIIRLFFDIQENIF